MRALVIDDERLVLDGFEAFLLASMPELTLDKTAEIETAVSLASSVKYGFVVLDWHLVRQDGEAVDARVVVQALRSAASVAPIIVVSGMGDESVDWPQLLLELGLSGFVPKTAGGPTLVDAIQVALRGGIYIPSKSLLQRIKSPYRRVAAGCEVQDPRLRYPELTERQAEVFMVMMTGVSDKQIARELGIAESTVKTHVSAILAIVGVGRRGEAIRQAISGSNARHA